METEVREDPEQRRFVLVLDGEPAGKADYRIRDGLTVITHSEVDPKFRGRGLGNELARQTLDLLRGRNARVVPACPFFAEFVAAHPEYADLVED
jgi:predicted GNAT family acetyltransferase